MSGRTKKKKKRSASSRSFWIVMLMVGAIAFVYRFMGEPPAETTPTLPLPAAEEIRVCFLDVGQGDSILIQTTEHTVLIDTGEYGARRALFTYLREAGVETLDYVVATHPHSDHIGAMSALIDTFDVQHVLMPDATNNTASYENLLKTIEEKDIPVTVPSAGDVITAGLIELEVLAPCGDNYSDLNDYSLVLRMKYHDTAFLFTGDAEWTSEAEMLASGRNLRANILKAGHHGSNSSTSDAFLDAVRPSAVVISCGKDNSYGHPHAQTLESLAERDIAVYRTDEMSSILMSTNGNEIKLYVEES